MHNQKTRSGRCSNWYVCPDSLAIWFSTCVFPCGSLSFETTVIVSFEGRHRCGEVDVECGADFFGPNLVCFHLLPWTDRESLHALQHTNQPVHIAVAQIDFGANGHLQGSRFLSPAVRSEFRPS